MKEFIAYILQYDDLTQQQQVDLITGKAEEIELDKGEYFVEAGSIFKEVGYVLNGIFRICYYNNKGEEITKIFIEEKHLLLTLKMYLQRNTSKRQHIVNYLCFQIRIGNKFLRQ